METSARCLLLETWQSWNSISNLKTSGVVCCKHEVVTCDTREAFSSILGLV